MMWGAVIGEGRRLAESLMVDTCDIAGPATDPVFNETTGTYITTPGAVIYSGKCKRQTYAKRLETTSSAGGHQFIEARDGVHIPATAAFIPAKSVVTITSSPYDPSSVGIRLVVDGPGGKTLGTAQRLNVTEVVG